MTYNKSNHEYKIHDTILRKRVHKDRRQDILDNEDILYILNDNQKLKDCREYYVDGLGMRGFDKLSKSNFRKDKRFKIAAYSTDHGGRVLRIWANKYTPYNGDNVSESVVWPPNIGEPSVPCHRTCRNLDPYYPYYMK